VRPNPKCFKPYGGYNGREGIPSWMVQLLDSVSYRSDDMGLCFDWSSDRGNLMLYVTRKSSPCVDNGQPGPVRFARAVVFDDLYRQSASPYEFLLREVAAAFAMALLHELDEQLVVGGALACNPHDPDRMAHLHRVAKRFSEGLTPRQLPSTLLSHEDAEAQSGRQGDGGQLGQLPCADRQAP